MGAQPASAAPDFSCSHAGALMEVDSDSEDSNLRSLNDPGPAVPPAEATHGTYEWKKYGKKTAKSSVHPRKYLRCKFRGCVALKTEEVLEGGRVG